METRGLVDLQAAGRATIDHPDPTLKKIPSKKVSLRPWLLLTWAGIFALLFAALRETPVAEIVRLFAQMDTGQILLLASINVAFLLFINARWALLLRSLGWKIPLSSLMLYRLAGFSVSYISPGPQFGGEPIQVHLLHRKERVPLTAAISSVFLDRLVDLLANFTFLFIGCLVVLFSGLIPGWQSSAAWLFVLILLLLPVGHLIALSQNMRPFTWMIRRFQTRWPLLVRVRELVCQSEDQIVGFVRTKPGTLVMMIGLSGVVWGLAVLEFWLLLRFLGVMTGSVETISALTAARLAFLLPLPGGLGALEISQTLAAQLLGWSPAVGIAISLIIRARDILLAVVGLGVGGYAYRSFFFQLRENKERS